MNDETHVALVDPHAERDRRDNDVDIFVDKSVLVFSPTFVRHTSVIGQRFKPQSIE